MERKKYIDFYTPMNEVSIKGTKITVPIWGGEDEAILSTWAEIKKLGFKSRQRMFGTLKDGTPALYFMGFESDPFKRVWYVTKEHIEDLHD